MSFKSKQRAKHGHLFGDDPLNAALVTASDGPLFTPTKMSKSSRTSSPASTDPLSRNSRPSSPLDTSSSTPISPRRTTATTTSKTSGSIFGDIDVSKLGGGGSGNSNGLYNKRVSTTSLRSSATLRSSKQFDEDEEDLFGGGRVSRTRVVSKATSPTLSNTSSASKKSPPSNSSPILSAEPTTTTILPTPRKSPTPPPPPRQPTPEITTTAPAPSSQQQPPIEENTRPVIEEKPSSSFFASASRFFKSSSNNQSKTSSSASSIASVNSSNIPQDDSVASNARKNPPSTGQQQPPQPSQQTQPPQLPQQTQQPKPISIQQNIPAIQSRNMVNNHAVKEEEEEEEEEEEHVNGHVIEDEATLAFADDVINFKAKSYQPDYASITPDLSMDALSLDVHSNKRLLPSASTPTASQADVDDPWYDGAAILSSTHTSSFATPSSKLPISLNIEPSLSSPLQQRSQHKIAVEEIEPQKRSAFADLISSWNTGQTSSNDVYGAVHTEDPEQFFSHVAEEQRDIGFAGITGEEDEDEREHRRTRTISVEVWHDNEENPWN